MQQDEDFRTKEKHELSWGRSAEGLRAKIFQREKRK